MAEEWRFPEHASDVRSFAAFAVRAREGGLVPVWRHALLDTDTPVSAFAKLRRGPFAFLLESAPAGSETWSRYTFMGTEPRGAWRLTDGTVEEWTPAAGWHGARRPADPLADLEGVLGRHGPVTTAGVEGPWAGAVGYLSYDVVRHIERLPDAPPRGVPTPDALLVMPGVLVVLDNLKGAAQLILGVPVEPGTGEAALRALWEEAQSRLEDVLGRLQAPRALPPLVLDLAAPPATGTSVLTRERFEAGVARIKAYIAAGDCFQVLLARRIRVPLDFRTDDLYRALRALNPSPYMYHLVLDGVELVGSSPELLVRVADGAVTVRPIAGTRPRGATTADDARLAAELAADTKERAEHVMLVDLGRNDVGRVARYGTVQVTQFMVTEAYSHVFHLVSEVTGQLRPGVSALDVFRATFPAGTMSGAPKVRAMQIIDELEPERRGPYAGAVGWIGAGGDRMDLAITIRTCVIAGGEASVQAGGGIVADSVPATEWEETESKARAMLTAIGRVRRLAPAVVLLALALAAACERKAPANNALATSAAARWCDQLPRAAHKALARVDAGSGWFDVYEVDSGVYALVESRQFQEAISYLVLGTTQALLFDGGIGLVPMRPVIERLTALPVTVMNSHTHFDHVGANAEFGDVLGMDTPYTRRNEGGVVHAALTGEVAAESFCSRPPEGTDTAGYRTRPWTVTRRVADGDPIDLGGRVLEILHVPGHTPDATALLDRAHGLLFTGDSYYAGPIWLFVPETNLDAYERSLARMVALAPALRRLLPAHNTASEPPSRLAVVAAAVRTMRAGGGTRTALEGTRVLVTVGDVQIMTSQPLLDGKRGTDTAGGSGLGPLP